MISETIESIGIELEGGLNYSESDRIKEYVESYDVEDRFDKTDDGSVRVSNKQIEDAEITYWHEDLDKFYDFIEFCFEVGLKQNSSCGNHVHVKFKELDKAVSVFSFKPAWNEFMKKYVEFAKKQEDSEKYLKRLENGYCRGTKRNETYIINQLNTKSGKAGGRYTAINLNSYNLYKTIEFRLIPYFKDFNEAENTINWLIKTVDEIIGKYSRVAITVATKTSHINTNANQRNDLEYLEREFNAFKSVDVKKHRFSRKSTITVHKLDEIEMIEKDEIKNLNKKNLVKKKKPVKTKITSRSNSMSWSEYINGMINEGDE